MRVRGRLPSEVFSAPTPFWDGCAGNICTTGTVLVLVSFAIADVLRFKSVAGNDAEFAEARSKGRAARWSCATACGSSGSGSSRLSSTPCARATTCQVCTAGVSGAVGGAGGSVQNRRRRRVGAGGVGASSVSSDSGKRAIRSSASSGSPYSRCCTSASVSPSACSRLMATSCARWRRV